MLTECVLDKRSAHSIPALKNELFLNSPNPLIIVSLLSYNLYDIWLDFIS